LPSSIASGGSTNTLARVAEFVVHDAADRARAYCAPG
jgi:hypothetical protein